ncbi:MAG: 4-phosphopantetheinyl transferase family protein [Chitinophagaceae bacterium]|nr:4-phosphopantetheinyl transferase family protein [Chitinophagaceae bacterium]
MTGNDIVDLASAASESHWKRKGFLEKLFTAEEQRYIRSAASPELIVWRMWTMKESAYKIYTQQHGGRFFAPQKFNCRILSTILGEVIFREHIYQTQTQCTAEYVYSIAGVKALGLNPFLNTCFTVSGHSYPATANFVYQKIIADYARATDQKKTNYTLAKDRNYVPFLYNKADRYCIPISITHHGRYAAFTIN